MFGGVVNDNIVFPVLDLIKRELNSQGYNFDGIPSVNLYRDHPLDNTRVTSIDLIYESGVRETIILGLGSEDIYSYPKDVTPNSHDYEFFRYYRLNEVTVTYYNKGGGVIANYKIGLNYDYNGLLVGTSILKQ